MEANSPNSGFVAIRCSCSGSVRYGIELHDDANLPGWSQWVGPVGGPGKAATIPCTNDFFEGQPSTKGSSSQHAHDGDPAPGRDKACEYLEGYFPAFPDCTAPTCFSFTDQPTAPGEDSSCCKWRDSAASEWVPAGETRPCSYEMGEEPGLRIGLAPTLWGWPAWG